MDPSRKRTPATARGKQAVSRGVVKPASPRSASSAGGAPTRTNGLKDERGRSATPASSARRSAKFPAAKPKPASASRVSSSTKSKRVTGKSSSQTVRAASKPAAAKSPAKLTKEELAKKQRADALDRRIAVQQLEVERRRQERRLERGLDAYDELAKGRNGHKGNSKLAKQAADNMMEALGGREAVIQILMESGEKSAMALADRLMDSALAHESFTTAYTSLGLKAVDILALFNDGERAKTIIRAIRESNDVMKSVVRAAKDQLEPHRKCGGSGKVLDKKTGDPTEQECPDCDGTGYKLVSGERDAQQLFYELIGWRKSGGGTSIVNDNRRQQVVLPAGSVGSGEAPNALSIIKKADQVLLPPVAASSSLPPAAQASLRDTGLPEDNVVEPELVER